MSFADDQTQQIINALTSIDPPEDRARAVGEMLKGVPALQRALREARQAAVLEMRAAGASHADVGAALGVSKGRAQQIAEGRTS
ncbi:hypothetical protein ABZ234_18380 [Nocardiopsis sp. NPDC006198]|uniref:hypothetical protein n=1 Tax=Nocardiopsis sp. NPDC006198 TaxID=3154472 RepID=UPI002E89C7E6|nr:hypothetical protein [Nocardiopsis tropica]